MADFPGGCKNVQQYGYFVLCKVMECIMEHMSKEETASYLRDQFQIESSMTNIVWENTKLSNPAFFRSYGAENNGRIREGNAPSTQIENPETSPPESDSAMARRRAIPRAREQEQQRLIPPTARRLMETAPNLQRYAAASTQVPQEAANANANANANAEQIPSKAGPSKALKKQKLLASQQPVYSKIEVWQKLLSTLGQIRSNTDQMVKLLTDRHTIGPHRSAPGSFIRQRVEQAKERGDNEEAEKLQEKERGENEEAEKLQEKERGKNEEAEKMRDQNLKLP